MLILVISIFFIFLLSIVNAQSEFQQETSSKITNLFAKLKYLSTKGFLLFSAWGEVNDCSTYPDNGEGEWIYQERIDCNDYCSYDKCALDIWWGDTSGGDPNWNHYYGEINGEGASFTPTSSLHYFVQVYCCPETSSNGDWETRVYVCHDGEWNYKGTYEIDDYCSYGDEGCWCNDEDENFYVDNSGNEHCVNSPDSSWCTTPTQTCSDIGLISCSSSQIGNLQCINGDSYSCGYESNIDTTCWHLFEDCSSNEICSNGECIIEGGETCAELGTDMNECYNRADCMWTRFSNCKTIENAECTGMREQDCLQGSECEWTGTTCQFKNGEKGEIGDSCSVNSDCISNYCDKSHWYSFGTTCQPTPWSLTKKVGLTNQQISDSTVNDLLSVACLSNSECLPQNENMSAKCIPISKLKEEGILISGVDSFFDNAKDTISAGITGGVIGGVIGGVVCAGATTATIILAPTVAGSVAFGSIAATTCTTLTVGGAILGGNIGVGFNDKDDIVDKLQASDADSVGLCVSESGGLGDLGKYTKWAAFFDITQDGKKDGIDGLIIIIGLIILIGVILK